MRARRHGELLRRWARCATQVRLVLALLMLTPLASHAAAAARARALTNAAASGDLAKVRSAIQSGVNLNARDDQGRTALLSAAASGHLAVAQALIDAKADVNATARSGLSALIAATQRGDADMARVLLAAGADPNLIDRGHGTALELAERNGDQGLATLLRAHGARGAGKSVGDSVCVRVWKGQGYCGVVTAVEGLEWTLRVTRIVACAEGCTPGPCSMGRTVGGGQAGSVAVNDEMRVEGACLTHTGVLPETR